LFSSDHELIDRRWCVVIDFLMIDAHEYEDMYIERLVDENPTACTELKVYETSTIGEQVWKCKAVLKNRKIIFVDFEVATYQSIRQLRVHITADHNVGILDEDLHSFKIQLKNRLLKDWKRCVWVDDQQAAKISEELYPKFYAAENLVRRFLNNVMVTLYGPEWWERLAPIRLKLKHTKRLGKYRGLVPSFANVSDHLMSIDVDDLVDLMKIQIKILKLSDDDQQQINTLLNQSDSAEKIMSELKSKLQTHTDLWQSVFQKLLDPNFEEEWKTFYKNRNHVAHNKLIDLAGRNKMIENISTVTEMIENALDKFSKDTLSSERQEFLEILDDLRQTEFEEAYESSIEEMTGVSILDQESIAQQFDDDIHQFLENISDRLYFRRGVNMSLGKIDLLSEECVLATISSTIDNSNIRIIAVPELYDDPGETSVITISVRNDDQVLNQCEIKYINGRYEEVDTGVFLPVVENELLTDELLDFADQVIGACDTVITTPIDLLRRAETSAKRNGGSSVIADFACSECGEHGVCLDESILPLGECAHCGAEHEIVECERCGILIDSNDSYTYVGISLCENCYEEYQQQ